MLLTLQESIAYFFTQMLDAKLSPASRIGGELYGAAIPIKQEGKAEYHFYLFFSKKTIQSIAKTWLSKPLDEDEMNDFLKELANQIIGHTKNALNEERKTTEFSLGIPEYLGRVESFANYKLKNKCTYRLGGRCFRIGYIKE